MHQSAYRPTKVRKKTQEVVNYHYNDAEPGKPLHLLVPGAGIAIASLGTIIAVIVQTWFQRTWSEDAGISWLAALTPVYIGGVFLFSYGYELYAVDRALWLTALIVFSTVAIVLIIAVIAVLLGAGGSSSGGGSGSSKKKDSSSGGGSSSSGPSGGVNLGFLDTVSTPSSNSGNLIGEVIESWLGNSDTGTVVATASADETFESDDKPEPAVCAYCASTFVPEESAFTCPKCGAGYRDEDAAE